MKINRNDPCPCGSGKKYKKCCISNPKIKGKKLSKQMIEKFIELDDFRVKEDWSNVRRVSQYFINNNIFKLPRDIQPGGNWDDAEFVNFYFLLAHAHLMLKEYKSALNNFPKAAAVDSNHTTTLFWWSDCLCAIGNFNEAVGKLEIILKKDPKHVNAIVNHYRLLIALGEYNKAYTTYYTMFQSNNDIINNDIINVVLREFILCLYELDKFDEAYQFLESEIKKKPNDSYLYNIWGNMLLRDVRRTVSFNRSNLETLKIEKALELLEYALELFENNHCEDHLFKAKIFNNLGVCYDLLGFNEKFIDMSKSTTSLAPNNGNYWYNLAFGQKRMSQFSDADKSFEKSVRLSPNNYKALTEWGSVLIELGEYDEAISKLIKAKNHTNSWQPKIVLGFAYYYKRDYEKAIVEFKNVKDYQSEDVTGILEKMNFEDQIILKMLGLCYEKNGELDAAISVYNNILNINSNNHEVKKYLKRAIETRDDTKPIQWDSINKQIDDTVKKNNQIYQIHFQAILDELGKLKTTVRSQGEKTRNKVEQEHMKTRSILYSIIADIENIQVSIDENITDEKIQKVAYKISEEINRKRSQFNLQSVKNNLKRDLGSVYQKMSEKSLTFLHTGEYLLLTLPENLNNFSPCLVEYAKVVENNLFRIIATPIRNWVNQQKIEISAGTNDFYRKSWNKSIVIEKFKKITLGNYVHLLKDKNVEKFLKNSSKDFSYLYSRNAEGKSLTRDLVKIINLRNGCAHKETSTKEKAQEFRKFLIDDGFLKRIENL